MKGYIPKITSRINSEETFENSSYHMIVENTLRKILPKNLFSESLAESEKEQFANLLPHVAFIKPKQFPGNYSFFVLAKYRFSSFKFFFEMISHWLVPGKRLNVVLLYGMDYP